MMTKATNLREALNLLNPEQSLQTENELKEFFVARRLSPLPDMRMLLQDTYDKQKVLFTGHRGSGKSTELAKLVQELQPDFFVVDYSIKKKPSLFDLTYVDVILSLALELFRKATEPVGGQGLMKINPDVLTQINLFTNEITKEVELEIKAQAEIGTEINVKAVKLSSKLGTEAATRTTVREKVTHRLNDLLEIIDLLAREIERNAHKRTLVVIEDLDKADLETAKKLFYEHATSLLAPEVDIIYTFPIALRHDNDFMQVKTSFPNLYILPIFKTQLRDGQPNEEGLQRLREILVKRADASLFTPDALTALAHCSSGIPRELISLARRACLEARKSDRPQIDSDAVERAARSHRRDYQVTLTTEQLKLLKKVQESKWVENDEAYRALLHNLSVLEYQNDEIWYDVHPVVQPLLLPED